MTSFTLHTIFVLCLFRLPNQLLAVDENVISSTTMESDPSYSPTPKAIPVTPFQPVTANVCNMSLITSVQNENAIQKKCSCDLRLGNVDCSNLHITELPEEISFPKSVHVANFRNNKITNIHAETFYNGREVIELDLSDNQIDFISITAFKAFKKLTRLDLSHNRIWNIPKDMFTGLNELRTLDLSHNDLMNVYPGHLLELRELRDLNLKSNPLEVLEPKHFEHLQKLEKLDLEATMLKVIPDHVFVFTPHLKVLKLGNNQLTEVPTEALSPLDHLRTLDLSGNPIEIIHTEAFRGLRVLMTLHLDRMPNLVNIEKYAFGDMIHLQELHCNYNFMLSDISEYAFVKKSSNEKASPVQLFLRQNALESIPKSLLDWNSGVELHLRDNPLHCDCNIDWMVNLKLKNDFQTHAKCLTPVEYEGVSLWELKGHALTCGLQLADIILIVSGTVVALLILVLIVSFLVWRRNYRGYTKPHFYAVKKHHVNDVDYTGGDDGF